MITETVPFHELDQANIAATAIPVVTSNSFVKSTNYVTEGYNYYGYEYFYY